MKRTSMWGALAVLGAWCATSATGAWAQSSVTLYGIVDTGVRYMTHVNRAGDASLRLMDSGTQQSRFGLLGSEDLGGGLSAIFRLESRINMNNGQQANSPILFNTAFVGLRSTTYGALMVGRQFSVLIDVVSRTYASNGWLPYTYSFQPEIIAMGGTWSSNMTKYAVRMGDVLGEMSYAFGSTAGHTSYGSQFGVGVSYAPSDGVRGAAGFTDTRDSLNGSHLKVATVGGGYRLGKSEIHATFYGNWRDVAFHTYDNGPFTAATLAALKFTDFRVRRMFGIGISHAVLDNLNVGVNFWRTLQRGNTASLDGSASQFQVVGDYALSKRTSLYAETDYAMYRGGTIGAQLQGINGLGTAAQSTQLGMMAGMRHAF